MNHYLIKLIKQCMQSITFNSLMIVNIYFIRINLIKIKHLNIHKILFEIIKI